MLTDVQIHQCLKKCVTMEKSARLEFKLQLIRDNLTLTKQDKGGGNGYKTVTKIKDTKMPSNTNTYTPPSPLPLPPKNPVTLPIHPRSVKRSSSLFEETSQSLITSFCPTLKNLQELIKSWQSRMKRYVGVMKIGFPVMGEGGERGWVWEGGVEGVMEGKGERLTLSRDGRKVLWTVEGESGEEVKTETLIKDITGLAVNPSKQQEDGDGYEPVFNSTSFSILTNNGETMGPFTPPTDLELRSWCLVVSAMRSKSGLGLNRHQINFGNVATMIVSEVRSKLLTDTNLIILNSANTFKTTDGSSHKRNRYWKR